MNEKLIKNILIGSPSDFGIETKIYTSGTPGLFFGYLRLWVYGQPIGDFDSYTCLNSSLIQFRKFISQSKLRNIDCLWSLESDETVKLVNKAIDEVQDRHEKVVCGAGKIDSEIVYPTRLAPNGTEPFDRCCVIVLQSENHQKIVWQIGNEPSQSLLTAPETVEGVLKQLISVFEKIQLTPST